VRDGFHYTFWVYILTSRTGTLYIGITGYFDRRISQHKMDSIEGFTKKYKVHQLVYYETFGHVQNAIRRDKQLKGLEAREGNCADRKIQPALAGPLRILGTRNAVPGTASQENSLMRHGYGYILGILRLRAHQPFQYRIHAALRSG
jgi:putative endonuclease